MEPGDVVDLGVGLHMAREDHGGSLPNALFEALLLRLRQGRLLEDLLRMYASAQRRRLQRHRQAGHRHV